MLISGQQLRDLLKWPRVLPLEEERVRLLHEAWSSCLHNAPFGSDHLSVSLISSIFQVGSVLEESFGGKAANLVKSCGNSASTLVHLLTQYFPGKCYFELSLFAKFSIFSESVQVQFNIGHMKMEFC